MATILRLPTEVTLLVSHELPSHDFLHFRQTCKVINERTNIHFLAQYFRTRYVMLEHRSLVNLVAISRRPILGAAVRTLEICIDHLTNADYASSPERDALTDGTTRREVHSCNSDGDAECTSPSDNHNRPIDMDMYAERLEDQRNLASSGLAVAYLTAAMDNLVNCRTIVINDETRPWGASTLARELGVMPRSNVNEWRYESAEFAQRAIRDVLVSVSASSLQLEELDISFGYLKDHSCCVSPDMLAIPERLAAQLKPHLASVVSLGLVLSSEAFLHRAKGTWAADFVGFVDLFQGLSHLDICFQYRDEHQCFPRLCEVLKVPNLESLSLDCLDCTEGELVQLLTRHKNTLKDITFSSIDILAGGGTWASVVRTIRDTLKVDRFGMYQCLSAGVDLVERADGDCVRSSFYAEDWDEFTDLIRILDSGLS